MSFDLQAETERAKFIDWIEDNKDKILNYLLLEEEDLLLKLYNNKELIK